MANHAGECFVVLGDCGESVIFGRNSIKKDDENAEVVFLPVNAAEEDSKKCSVEVEGKASFAIILNRTIGNWGCGSGANEKGVCIGLSWSENEEDGSILGTELVRLGLERSGTASEAVDVITELNDKHGSSGKEGREANKMSFLICDNQEAWLLDIVGKCWASENLSTGYRKLPLGLGVTTKIDKSSDNLKQKAQDLGLWDGAGDFNFQSSFSTLNSADWTGDCPSPDTKFSLEKMFKSLRSESSNSEKIKSSQVSTLSISGLSCHWFTATPNVSESVFKPFVFTENARISPLTVFDPAKDPNWTVLGKYHSSRDWNQVGDLLKSLEETCINEVKEVLASDCDPSELDDLMKDCVEAEVKFYR